MRSILLALLAGCAAHEVVVGDLQEVADVPYKPNRDVDILFVIDNSPSMADKQVSLAQNFPRMIDVLSTLDAGLPNLHIGVVTSDMGTSSSSTAMNAPPIGAGAGACAGKGNDGTLQHKSTAVTDAYISDIGNPDGSRTTNYTGDLHDVFTTTAEVGDLGCGFEQHLSSMRAALDNNPANAGFIRDSANLAVVILADEDDCSAKDPALFSSDPTLGPLQSYRCTKYGIVCDPDDPDNPHSDLTDCRPRADSPYVDDVQPYVDFLTGLKPDPRMLLVSTIIGDPTPVATELATPPGGGAPIMALSHSCTFEEPDTTLAVADPGVRLAAFANAFSGRSSQTSICSADLSGALQQIGESAKQLVGDPCLTQSPVVDSCEVTAVSDAHPELVAQVPRCGENSVERCYEIAADPAACSYTSTHLKVVVNNTDATAPDTWFHVRCQLEP